MADGSAWLWLLRGCGSVVARAGSAIDPRHLDVTGSS